VTFKKKKLVLNPYNTVRVKIFTPSTDRNRLIIYNVWL